MNDQARRLRELTAFYYADKKKNNVLSSPRRCISIAVSSGKGGVGKSNVSVYLAQTLALLNKKVLLFDADIGLANIHILLGINPRKTFKDVIDGRCSINDAMYGGPAGITIIPGTTGFKEIVEVSSHRMYELLQMLKKIENRYDYLIIDSSAGIGQQVISFAQHVDIPLVVMSPDPTSLTDAYTLIKILGHYHSFSPHVIVNMARSAKEGLETIDKLSLLLKRFLKLSLENYLILPYDQSIAQAVKGQGDVMRINPNTLFIHRLKEYARLLTGKTKNTRDGFFGRILNKNYQDTVKIAL